MITPDLGTGTTSTPTCDVMGDDGILRSTTGGGGSCPPSFPTRIFSFDPLADDITSFAADFACVAQAGTGGCGFEQQLEATLKALSPAAPTAWVTSTYAPPSFLAGTGHGDGANNGFVRDGSLLAVTLFTDEGDCSTTDNGLFDTTDARFSGTALNLRCSSFDDVLFPVGRYVDGLLQLREDPRLLVFGVVAGVPVDLIGLDGEARYQSMLDDPRMANTVDPASSNRLLPSCNSGTSGVAFPARRLVTTARDLAHEGVPTRVGSICASSYASDISVMVRAIVAGAPSCM